MDLPVGLLEEMDAVLVDEARGAASRRGTREGTQVMAGADVVVRFLADTTQLDNATKQIEGTGARMRAVGKTIAGAIGGAAIVGAIVKTTQAASDLNETVTASQQIFGKSAKSIESWASGAAHDFGQSKREALEAATGFGNMFQQLGVGEAPAVNMSKRMVELASDFASFRNADVSDVLEAQQAAFRGEYDALQKFVPTISAATVETKALSETGKENAKQLTAQEKAHAAYTLMIEGAGKAMGDFDRTSGGAANQQRILQAQMEDLQASIGTALLPTLTVALGVLSKVADVFMSLPGPIQTAVVALGLFAAAWAVLEALNVTTAIASMVSALPKLGSALTTAGLEVAAFAESVASLSTIGAAAGLGILLFAAYMLRFKTETEKAADAGKRQGEVMVQNITAGTTAATALQELTRTQAVLTAKIHETREAYELYNLAAANNAAAIQETGTNARGASEKAHELGVELANLQGKHDALAPAIKNAEQAQKTARIEEEARRAGLVNLAAGTQQSTDATLASVSALQTYANQMLAMQGGAIGLEAAQLNVMRAEENLAKVRADGTSTLLDIATAENNLKNAKLGVAAAAVDANAKETAFVATLNQSAIPGLEATRAALEQQKQATGDATGAIQEQIDKTNWYIGVAKSIPTEVVTKAVFDAENASKRAQDYHNQLLALPTDVRTQAILAIQGIYGNAPVKSFGGGGVVPGPVGSPQLILAHGGETVVPTSGARGVGAASVFNAGGRTYNIAVNVAAGMSPAMVGAATVDAIRAYERQNGRSWRD